MEISLFDAALKGLLNLLQLKVFLAMMVGVSIGTFTAVAPQGLGMPLVYAIALPIVIRWEPITGIALLIGASSVSAICAAYLPILFGIPGGAGSQATVLDGYPIIWTDVLTPFGTSASASPIQPPPIALYRFAYDWKS